jgi:uncharacterized protein YecE (DUF72 family)
MTAKSPRLLYTGTSSFTAKGWEKAFYPAGLATRDYLSYYATQFDALEIDATFYAIPAVSTVQCWNAKTPPGFLFALKAPQEITHERVLVDADAAMNEFLHATEPLGEKLGVILLQLPYFSKAAFRTSSEFLDRLKPFLGKLPAQPRFALELRNKSWLTAELFELLRKHKVALALIDHPLMPKPEELLAKGDPITADFTYVRWLGDRKGIEERTKVWDQTIVDRTQELQGWARVCRAFLRRSLHVFLFANNHYAGYAPDTVRLFEELLEREGGLGEQKERRLKKTRVSVPRQQSLFE